MVVSELDLVIDNFLVQEILNKHKIMFRQVQEQRYISNINHVLFEIQLVCDVPLEKKENPNPYHVSGILITAPDTDATYFFSEYTKIDEYFNMDDRGIIQSNMHYAKIKELFGAIIIDIMTFILIVSTPQGYDGVPLNSELDEEDLEEQEEEEFNTQMMQDQVDNLVKREAKLRGRLANKKRAKTPP